MSSEISSIVPTPSDGDKGEVAEVDPEVYTTNLASDAVEFLETEFGEQVSDMKLFWSLLQKNLSAKIGDKEIEKESETVAVHEIKPMESKQFKSFQTQLLPWGKYEGQKISTVLKKDREALERMAVKPLPFQSALARFLHTLKMQENSTKKNS